MDNNQIIIPEGWTYYAHRTNTSRWDSDPFNMDIITTNKIVSVVTEREIYQELRDYGENYLLSYSSGKGEPFEIRCLICNLSHIRTLDDTNELKNVMLKEYYFDKRNFGGCYGQRHHSIPPKEELVVIGVGDHDEVFNREEKIIWTIPKRFIEFYKKEVERNKNRVINIQKADVLHR
jgi:hypothetical protein